MFNGHHIDLWNLLQQYLVVKVSDDKRSISVENTAIDSPFIPTIRFTEISVEPFAGTPLPSGFPSTLEPGQVVVISQEDNDVEIESVNLSAKIDIDEYMKFSVLSESSAQQIQLLVSDWYERFDEFDLFRRLDAFVSAIPRVTRESTLAEIENLTVIGPLLDEIYRGFDEQVGRSLPMENRANPHRLIRSTLSEFGTHVRRIIKAVENKDVSAISQEYEKLLEVKDPSTEFNSLRNRVEAAYLLSS